MPSGYHLVGSGALTTLTATATQAVTVGHGARRGWDSDQHGKHGRSERRCRSFKAPLPFFTSGWSLWFVRRNAEVELLPVGPDLGR